MRTCKHCGTKLTADSKYCTKCDRMLKSSEVARRTIGGEKFRNILSVLAAGGVLLAVEFGEEVFDAFKSGRISVNWLILGAGLLIVILMMLGVFRSD